MKKKIKSILSCIMTFLFIFTSINIMPMKVSASNTDLLNKVNTSMSKVHNFIIKNGTWSSDWKTVAFNKSGLKLPTNYNSDYLKNTEKVLKDAKAYFYKVTDYERITLGVVAAGGDPRNIAGYNLLDKIYNFYDPKNPNRKIDFQGLNGVIYGLIALDTKNYQIPAGAKFTREYMLDYVLENRNSDGGWDLNMNGNHSDVDITSMTLIALAPYHNYVSKSGKKVVDAVREAVQWLSKVQRKDGGFNSWFTENNSESCAQTIIGLCANGIDPTSAQFTKDRNLVENLLRFQQSNGEFYHLMDGSEGVNGMSTEQAYQALVAYKCFASGKGSIYWFDGKKLPNTFKNTDMSNSNVNTEVKEQSKTDNLDIDKDVFVATGDGKTQRVAGNDRFDTSINVAKKLSSRKEEEKFKNIIISSGFGFADSLCGSVLAKQLDAPILLVGKDINSSEKVLNYIKSNLNKDGNVYVLGGEGSVSNIIENTIKNSGYKVKRLAGKDRFQTCNEVFKQVNAKEKTPFVIVNGLNFADALSVSAPASINGYPVLLSGKTSLPDYVKNAINDVKPSEVFIIGGEGAISKNIEGELNKINSQTKITRIAGKDRYDTSLKVNQYFKNNESVLLASGQNYPDALSGSALASQINGSLLLVNDSSLSKQINFIDKDKTDEVIILGGNASVSKRVQETIEKLFK
ncbi:putative cell wall-binding protein [Clostridium tetanomorphum]|uniref:cell wall-binding repeat-containing protein n=2 Tax=Clostridium tetanomorphum TaxID=1553 RepID=UPI00044F6146|nr:cell wall-binding repeat-containing protein [Clostridium tetanomorphum]KAJ51842.1 N-acetylmuramoyl-L-alanine amidase [Clostridium tetanomorphum DSM 665]MBP1865079.1 putative cell wall-binding protein [Clostridium tetanomorphum]NRS83323.1 putative cell wall-binding protein [Clostridium tetanomorphum]